MISMFDFVKLSNLINFVNLAISRPTELTEPQISKTHGATVQGYGAVGLDQLDGFQAPFEDTSGSTSLLNMFFFIFRYDI